MSKNGKKMRMGNLYRVHSQKGRGREANAYYAIKVHVPDGESISALNDKEIGLLVTERELKIMMKRYSKGEQPVTYY
jgi:hypothetical protein